MEDQLALLHGLWEEAPGWNFDGHQVAVRGGKLVPGPVQSAGRPIAANGRSRPRIITGSEGSPRGFRLAARYSDEFNLSSSTPDIAREKQAQLDAACVAAGRDPKSLTRSAMVGVLIGATSGDVDGRAADLLTALGESGDGRAWLDKRRSRWIIGTPDEARAMVRRYADAGIERIMLQDLLPRDGDMIDLMAKELVGQV
jgi:alkanesulfonate monooxygenase SsuD/methylene tetrahydromethanopterin reductase-like flavin-dependent oxidoreductase (luciferase family)